MFTLFLNKLLTHGWYGVTFTLKVYLYLSPEMSNVNLKNKITSYFTSKMSLFRNSRGIAIRVKQTMVKHRQVWRTKEGRILLQGEVRSWEGLFLNKVHWRRVWVQGCGYFSLAELLWFLIGCVVAGVCKLSFFPLGNARLANSSQRWSKQGSLTGLPSLLFYLICFYFFKIFIGV